MTALEDYIYETQLKGWMDFIKYIDDKYSLHQNMNYGLSRFVKLETVVKYPDYNWSWEYLSANPNITFDIIKSNPQYEWDWYWVSLNPNITWDIIRDNPDEDWNWCRISYNPNITFDIIRDNPNYPWYWNSVSQNPNITYELALDNPDYPWNWRILKNGRCTTCSSVDWNLLKNPNKKIAKQWYVMTAKLYWYCISRHPNIMWNDIQSNPNLPWVWNSILTNPNITMDIILSNLNHPELFENICVIGRNPSMLWNELVNIGIDDGLINWVCFKDNNFPRQMDLIRQDCVINWRAANKIRKWWLFKCYLNPFHFVGQKRLNRSYQEMLKNDI